MYLPAPAGPSEMSELTRRGLLKRGTAAASVATLGGLAGCAGAGVLGGGGSARTLPAPSAVGQGDDYWFQTLDTAEVREYESSLTDYGEVTEMAAEYRGLADVESADTDAITTFAGNAVVSGSFSTEDARTVLESNDFTEAESESVGVLYVGPNEVFAVGIEGDALVFGREAGRTSAAEAIEATVAANGGDGDAYTEDDDFAELRDQLAEGTHVDGGTHGFSLLDGHVATGTTITLGESDSDFDLALVFGSESDIDEDGAADLASTVEDTSDIEDIDTSVDGRTLHVTGSVDTADVRPVSLTGRFSFW